MKSFLPIVTHPNSEALDATSVNDAAILTTAGSSLPEDKDGVPDVLNMPFSYENEECHDDDDADDDDNIVTEEHAYRTPKPVTTFALKKDEKGKGLSETDKLIRNRLSRMRQSPKTFTSHKKLDHAIELPME